MASRLRYFLKIWGCIVALVLFVLNITSVYELTNQQRLPPRAVRQIAHMEPSVQHDKKSSKGSGSEKKEEPSDARAEETSFLQEIRPVKSRSRVRIPFESNIVETVPEKFRPMKSRTPKQCSIYYPSNKKLHFSNIYWQVLNGPHWALYIYSAFYDNRKSVGKIPAIRILGISDSLPITRKLDLKCQLWFAERRTAEVVTARIRTLWPWKTQMQKRNLPVMFTCYLPKNSSGLIPFAVSIVKRKCDLASNKIRVIQPSLAAKVRIPAGFGVCVKALDFPDQDLSLRLIEWIELLKLVGVTRIHMYNYAVHPNIQKVLDFYYKEGVINVGMLTLPNSFPNDPKLRHIYLLKNILRKRHIEILPYNDCLYRNFHRYKYIALLDVDEIIVPLKVKTWGALMEDILENTISWRGNGWTSYQVKQSGCFFHGVPRLPFDQFPRTMHMLQHIYKIPKTEPFEMGMKGWFDPARVLVAFNHQPAACLNTSCHRFHVNENLAQLQHYKHILRHCGPRNASVLRDQCNSLDCLVHEEDKSIWKYRNRLVPKFKQVVKAIFKNHPPTLWTE